MEGRLRRRGLRALGSKGAVFLGALSLFGAATLSLLPGVASASSTITTETLYVTPSGNATSTTCSMAAPCSLTQAITLANNAFGDSVMVGAGTYDTGASNTSMNLTT
ncbi:MAG: hypothetical protein ACP5O0_09145, partial [Acidimicrobiales bacterium]